MDTDFQLINHCLFKNVLVLFVLPEPLTREQFERCIRVLQEKAGVEVTKESLDSYWRELEHRMSGNARWDLLSPPVDHKKDFVGYSRSIQKFENILARRLYKAFAVAGIQYLLEVFNPRNELGVNYPGAGAPVLTLLMKAEAYGTIDDRLCEHTEFYDILRQIAGICSAKQIVGMNSANLTNLIGAYLDKYLDPSTDPWSLLFPLQVRELAKHIGDVALSRYFTKVEDWGDGRLLLQVKPGIDYSINRQNTDAAALLGTTAVQNLNPDVRK